jgi:hypothetical protein
MGEGEEISSRQLLRLYHKHSYEELSEHLDDELLYPLTVQEPVINTVFEPADMGGNIGFCNELEPMYDSRLGISDNPKYKNSYGAGILIYSDDNLLGFWKYPGPKTMIALQHTVDSEGNLLLVPGGVYKPYFNELRLMDREKIPYKKRFRKADIKDLLDIHDTYLSKHLFPVRMFKFDEWGGNSYLDKLLERKKELE